MIPLLEAAALVFFFSNTLLAVSLLLDRARDRAASRTLTRANLEHVRTVAAAQARERLPKIKSGGPR